MVQIINNRKRRMYKNFYVDIMRNNLMKVYESGYEKSCFIYYRLKFYSSTVFIEKLDETLIGGVQNNNQGGQQNNNRDTFTNNNSVEGVDNNNSSSLKNDNNKNESESKDQSSVLNQENPQNKSSSNEVFNSTQSNKSNLTQNQQQIYAKTQKSLQMPTNTNTLDNNILPFNVKSCSTELFHSLNKILLQSHVWTFSENNFYLMGFLQQLDDGEQYTNSESQDVVLILNMVKKYQKV